MTTRTHGSATSSWCAAPGLPSYTELLQTAGLKVPFAEGSVKGIAQQMTRWLEEHQVG